MIPFDFEYHRPQSVDEALSLYQGLVARGKQPLWYGGGTEIICMARLYTIRPDAVIDIKAIPDCQAMERVGGRLIFGAGLTLAQIAAANPWPLLSQAAGRVADHTARWQITLGGNIAGKIPYREALLPFLLADARAVVAGANGVREVALAQIFSQQLDLGPGEILLQLSIDELDAQLPSAHVKRTRLDYIDYPLFTIAAMQKEGRVRMAFAGLCHFPFRSAAIEGSLNDRSLPYATRIERLQEQLPAPVVSDLHGSDGYRRFLLSSTVTEILAKLEG